ncbi:MAG: DUF1134 domain-containing protein [Pseudomonadota bacterium]
MAKDTLTNMRSISRFTLMTRFAAAVLVALAVTVSVPLKNVTAQTSLNPSANANPTQNTFSSQEIIDSGHLFFGNLAQGMAQVVEQLASRYGQPNGYILGEEAGGAFFGGVRYGEGILYTRNAGNHRVYWQGPSLGVDFGGEGTRTMMLVYNLPSTTSIYQRFPGASGSAFLVGGLSVSGAQSANIVVAPIRAGVGARLGLNVGYLKFTPQPTWNPF